MSLQVEKLEKNMAKLTIEVPAQEFETAVRKAYNHNKGRFNIPGFRKGKAPQMMIEKMYGTGIFFEEAANELIDESYPKAMDECGEVIVSSPDITVTQIEKGKPFIYEARVAVKPEVVLGEYKGIEVTKAEAAVTDEDVEKELEADREKNGRLISVEDRPVQDGDQTVIDFKGFIDGKAFEGGEGEDYELTIGSHSFIDTFEEQLIGKKIGEACEVLVTFPEAYHAPDLAGKPARFEVTVKEIRVTELPELNDEFASEVSDFETLAEYKDDIRAKLQERKERQAATTNENNVIEKVVENAQMELPQPMIDTQARGMVEDYARNLRRQGLNFNDYMKYTGMTVEKIMEQMAPQAEKRIRTRLVLEKVAEVENIQISDEAVDQEIEKMAASYKMDPARMKENMGEREIEQLKEDLMVQEAVDFLVSEAKLV
ncbi:trigger factor [Clostridiaceae bacterium]|nr:trigger factor [Clostridium sp.]NBI72059.1 trigger factor [Clostridiaceae bacterium]